MDEKLDWTEDEALLHVKDNDFMGIGREIAQFIENRLREMNPNHPPDAKFCLGCLINVCEHVAVQLARDHYLEDTPPSYFLRELAGDLKGMSNNLSLRGHLFGGEHKMIDSWDNES